MSIKKNKTTYALLVTVFTIILVISGKIIYSNTNNAQPAPAVQSPSMPIKPSTTAEPIQNKAPVSKPVAPASPAKANYGDPANILAVINKKNPLPDGYAPSDLSGILRSEAKMHLDSLIVQANSSNVALKVISGYRSQSSQSALYNSYVARDGKSAADTYSARPRHSEHQTGLAVDLGNSGGSCDLDICFANTVGGQWLKANAQNYGFIIRYPNGKTNITGYQYEPWHLRYVGVATAKSIHLGDKTLEEYFGLPPAPSY